jgi:hypothetical protein
MGLKTTFYSPYSWDSPNLEGHVPVFIYPRALGSLSVTSYDSRTIVEVFYPASTRDLWLWLKLKSKSCYDWRSVSQYVLVSSSLWNLWPDIIFCLKVAVLSLYGALSDERSGLSPVSHCQQYLVYCQRFNIIYIVHVTCFMYMQYTRVLDLCQHRLSTADHSKISVAYATTAA